MNLLFISAPSPASHWSHAMPRSSYVAVGALGRLRSDGGRRSELARRMARRRIDLQLAVDATVKKSGPFDAAAISERKTIAGEMVETSMMTLPGYLGVGREERSWGGAEPLGWGVAVAAGHTELWGSYHFFSKGTTSSENRQQSR